MLHYYVVNTRTLYAAIPSLPCPRVAWKYTPVREWFPISLQYKNSFVQTHLHHSIIGRTFLQPGLSSAAAYDYIIRLNRICPQYKCGGPDENNYICITQFRTTMCMYLNCQLSPQQIYCSINTLLLVNYTFI